MDAMYKLLAIDEIRSMAEADVRKQAALKRAIDPSDPLAQELEYHANRIHMKLCVREAEMRQFQIENSRRMAQTFFRWAEKQLARRGHDDPNTKDLFYHANRIEGIAQDREKAFEADRIDISVRDREVAHTIADASRVYAEQLLAKDPYDPNIEEIISHANCIEGTAEEREKEVKRALFDSKEGGSP